MKTEKAELTAYILIAVGVILLSITFYMAFSLLWTQLGNLFGLDLTKALGSVLGPISEAIIKIMYLGIMGWIGSILTMRGVQLIKETKQASQQRTQVIQPPSP